MEAFDAALADRWQAAGARMKAVAERGSAAESLVEVARQLYQRGWMDGTAGNLSVRLPESTDEALITASGRSKGALTVADVARIRIDDASPVEPDGPKPSAEAAIHAALLRRFGNSGAVVHAHPPYATVVASRAARGSASPQVRRVEFRDFELIKGFHVHDPSRVAVPVFPNWPDVTQVARDVDAYYADRPAGDPEVLLIAHHGATAWGPTLESARNALECIEGLCQLRVLDAIARTTEETS